MIYESVTFLRFVFLTFGLGKLRSKVLLSKCLVEKDLCRTSFLAFYWWTRTMRVFDEISFTKVNVSGTVEPCLVLQAF